MKPKVFLYTLLALISFFIFFSLYLSFWGFWQATHPAKLISQTSPKDLGWDFESITLKTADGLKLAAWFVPAKGNKAIILLHGYPADKGDLLHWTAFLKDNYNLLFFDFRYLGQSEGSFTSLGYHESKDVLAAIDFLKNKGIKRIGLMGFSFGASVGLLSLPKTNDVDAVVADSPFANLDLMGKTYYGHIPFLQRPLTLVTKFWGRIIYGIDANDVTPERSVAKTQVPILVIHSAQDELVLVENAYKLKEALANNKDAQVWIYDRGIHGSVGREHEEKVLEFFSKYL